MNASPTIHPDAAQRSDRLHGYLQQDPDNDRLRLDAFDAALAARQFERAQAYLEATDGTLPWVLRAGALQVALGDYAAAAAVLQPAVPAGLPGNDEALSVALMWLRASHQTGELEAAWAWLQRITAAGPVPPAIAALGSLLALDAGDAKTSERLADQALATFTESREALVAKGTALLGRRNATGARDLALAAMKAKDDGRARSLLAFALMLAGDLEQARQHFERAVQLMPEHVGTWQGLGWLHLCMGRLAEARSAFHEALERDRNFADNHGALAVVDAMSGQVEEARRGIEIAQRLDPACLSARYALAILNGEAADLETIQAIARDALRR